MDKIFLLVDIYRRLIHFLLNSFWQLFLQTFHLVDTERLILLSVLLVLRNKTKTSQFVSTTILKNSVCYLFSLL